MKIISLWSGPRNVSTALMYSFAQRDDMIVVDEPLYAHYLSNTDVDHIGKEVILKDMNNDGDEVIKSILNKKRQKFTFLKNMAHHWIKLNNEYLNNMENIFLIRDPEEMLPSLNQQLSNPTLRDTALKKQVEVYDYLVQTGGAPTIIDSKDLLQDPKAMLIAICDRLTVPFDEKMLRWKVGARPEDGVWAKYWYHNVHKSEGFSSYKKKDGPFPEHLKPLLKECKPYYKFLSDNSLKLTK